MKQFNYGPDRNPEKTVVHCPTQELAQKVLRLADTNWITGGKMYDINRWNIYNYATCYILNKGEYGYDEFYSRHSYDIISAEEFLALNEQFTLPEKWAVRLDFQEAVDYANEKGLEVILDGLFFHYPCSLFYLLEPGYTLLTKEQFLQHVWEKKDVKEKNPFKVGDKVYCVLFGWGEVTDICDTEFKVSVSYPDGAVRGYKSNGSYYRLAGPTLSFTEYTLQGFSQERPEPKKPEIKHKQLIYVKNDVTQEWKMRYFNKWDGDKVSTFLDQKKEGLTSNWCEYSLINPLEEKPSLYAHIKPVFDFFDSTHPNNSNY